MFNSAEQTVYAEADRAFQIVKSVIDAWDPYGLLRRGAPGNEFDLECNRLAWRIPHIHTPGDAIREISSVFARSFGLKHFSVTKCTDVGANLYLALEKAGLLNRHCDSPTAGL